MADERIDALLRRLEVAPGPDPSFVAATKADLLPLARSARARDATRLGRLWRDLASVTRSVSRQTAPRQLALIALIGLLLLATIAWIAIVASRTNPGPLGNGVVVISVAGRLTTIDVDSGASSPIGLPGDRDLHVSRSPDGQFLAYWQPDPDGDRLYRARIDGTGVFRLAGDRRVAMDECIDAWSPDSRSIATEVTVDRVSRILLVDARTGTSRFLTPDDVVARCPIWSPDGAWVAFQNATADRSDIDVIRADGSGMRSLTSNLIGFQADGPDTWSPEGWIYFGAEGSAWRADVRTGTSARMSDARLLVAAPTSSPDGSLLSYIVSTSVGWDLYIANADGSGAHPILKNARNNGWSADGRFILSRWMPPDQAGGLVLVTPEGNVRVFATAAATCPDLSVGCDLSWGQAKP